MLNCCPSPTLRLRATLCFPTKLDDRGGQADFYLFSSLRCFGKPFLRRFTLSFFSLSSRAAGHRECLDQFSAARVDKSV